jgi:hypothetical protein
MGQDMKREHDSPRSPSEDLNTLNARSDQVSLARRGVVAAGANAIMGRVADTDRSHSLIVEWHHATAELSPIRGVAIR